MTSTPTQSQARDEFEGKIAFITGGGRGQGRCHAVALAAAGADIAICDIEEQDPEMPVPTGAPGDLDTTRKQVEALGRRCLSAVADVRDRVALNGFVDLIMREFGRIDIAVANAGIYSAAPIHQMPDHQFDAVVQTNLTGVYNTIRAVAPIMVEQRSGRIIATASGAGRLGLPNLAHYNASKWGVIGLVKGSAIDLGPYNISVNAVCPATIDTPIVRNEFTRRLYNPELENPTDADVDRKILSGGKVPMPVAMLQPEEITNAVLFLASERAKYISGSTIDVGGGYAASHT